MSPSKTTLKAMASNPPKNITPPEEARLIAQKRAEIWPALSIARAAGLAGISPSRWRSIEKGWRWLRKGQAVESTAPAVTLATVARVLDIQPFELAQVGRPDAAEELTKLLETRGKRYNLTAVPDQELLDEIARRMSAVSKLDAAANRADRAVNRDIDPDSVSFSW